jgi:hypothetical protein
MRAYFPAAPWPTVLKVISLLGTVALSGICLAAYWVVPERGPFTHEFGLGVAMLPVLLLSGCILFVVRGYQVEGSDLCVLRLLWATRIPLAGLGRAWTEPGVCKGSMRIFGNGGLYSFTGLYSNKKLGRYRLFATDLARAVVLVLPQRVVVLTPADPPAFMEHLHQRFPGAEFAPLPERP